MGISFHRQDNIDVTSPTILLQIVRELGLNNFSYNIDENIFDNDNLRKTLWSNTETTFNQGAFGVPSFYIPKRDTFLFGKLLWLTYYIIFNIRSYFSGQDRMHILQAKLTALKLGIPLAKVPSIKQFHPRCHNAPLRYNDTAVENRTLTVIVFLL